MLRPEPEQESGEEGVKSCREIEMGAYQRQAGRQAGVCRARDGDICQAGWGEGFVFLLLCDT